MILLVYFEISQGLGVFGTETSFKRQISIGIACSTDM